MLFLLWKCCVYPQKLIQRNKRKLQEMDVYKVFVYLPSPVLLSAPVSMPYVNFSCSLSLCRIHFICREGSLPHCSIYMNQADKLTWAKELILIYWLVMKVESNKNICTNSLRGALIILHVTDCLMKMKMSENEWLD